METQRQTWDRIGDEWGPCLSYRLGMDFPVNGTQPTDDCGTLPHPAPRGAKVTKYYLPPQRIDLGTRKYAKYPVPIGVAQAPSAEIIFRKQRGVTVTFARWDETRAFGFDQSPYLRLKVPRKSVAEFETLYIRVSRDGVHSYYSLYVEWETTVDAYDYDAMHLFFTKVEERGVPDHLIGGPAR